MLKVNERWFLIVRVRMQDCGPVSSPLPVLKVNFVSKREGSIPRQKMQVCCLALPLWLWDPETSTGSPNCEMGMTGSEYYAEQFSFL